MKSPRTPTRTSRRQPAPASAPTAAQGGRGRMAIAAPRRLIDAELIIGGGLNARVFNLLAAIEREGSIVHAARAAGLSYRGAWDMIERASDLSPRPLIAKVIGGGEEKGTRLTETGQSLLAAYRRLQDEKAQFLDRLNEQFGHDPIILQWFRRIFMKSSARNQWSGTVASVKLGAVNAEVIISLKGGATLVASITHESAKSLGLEFGQTVIALVKAPMIMVLTDADGYDVTGDYTITYGTGSLTIYLATTTYTVQYYYDGVLDPTQTITRAGTQNDTITTYTPRQRDGYELDHTENFPLTLSANGNQNIIRVFYRTAANLIDITDLGIPLAGAGFGSLENGFTIE